MSWSGHELRNNNDKIIRLMKTLKGQRTEINFLIEKQQGEKENIQNEIEKLSFKLSLLAKSLNQRLVARTNYDKTIKEIEDHYNQLVHDSGRLLCCLSKEVSALEEIMDKSVSTVEANEPKDTDEGSEAAEGSEPTEE